MIISSHSLTIFCDAIESFHFIIGKSQVLSTRSYVYLPGYTQTRDRASTMSPPGQIGLTIQSSFQNQNENELPPNRAT